jgi:hypothetical protein
MTVTHFTPWDCNWPYGPPADAIPPPGDIPIADQQQPEIKICPTYTNSFVEDRGRIFHEDIPIPGMDVTLHYASNRAEGYKTSMSVHASGETIPSSLKSIIVNIKVAGRTFEQTLSPLPNQNVEYIWDGLDHLGKPVNGSIIAHISVGFLYDAVYYAATNFGQAFAQAGNEITGIRARQEVISWRRNNLTVYSEIKSKGVIAEGWTFSFQHQVRPINPYILHKGDGIIIKNDAQIIRTVAGNGEANFSGDGGPAVDASFYHPRGIAVDGEGNIFFANSSNNRIQ